MILNLLLQLVTATLAIGTTGSRHVYDDIEWSFIKTEAVESQVGSVKGLRA